MICDGQQENDGDMELGRGPSGLDRLECGKPIDTP